MLPEHLKEEIINAYNYLEVKVDDKMRKSYIFNNTYTITKGINLDEMLKFENYPIFSVHPIIGFNGGYLVNFHKPTTWGEFTHKIKTMCPIEKLSYIPNYIYLKTDMIAKKQQPLTFDEYLHLHLID